VGNSLGSVRQQSLLARLSMASLLMGSFVGEPIAHPPVGPTITAVAKKGSIGEGPFSPHLFGASGLSNGSRTRVGV